MKKSEQIVNNGMCVLMYNLIRTEYVPEKYTYKEKRLYNCNATIIETPSFIILKSYNTIVAAYSKATCTLYDFLRYVYGYTATSAQHISKFRKLLNCRTENVLTYRGV